MYENQQHLECVVREMLKSICAVNISFSVELRLLGTLGITVDKSNIFLIQIDEILDTTYAGVHPVPLGLPPLEPVVKIEYDDPPNQLYDWPANEQPNVNCIVPTDNKLPRICQEIKHMNQSQYETNNVGVNCNVDSSSDLTLDSDPQRLAHLTASSTPVSKSSESAVLASDTTASQPSHISAEVTVCHLPLIPKWKKRASVKLKHIDACKYLNNSSNSKMEMPYADGKPTAGKTNRASSLKDDFIYDSPCIPRERKRPRPIADGDKEEKWAGNLFKRWCDSTGVRFDLRSLSGDKLHEIIGSFFEYAATTYHLSTISCLRSGMKRYFMTSFNRDIDSG